MVVGRNAHTTIPKGNMGYDQYTVRNDCSCRTYFCCFPLALANICPWPPVPFFQISLKKSALKATHNTFRDCRVHFFRQLSRNSCTRMSDYFFVKTCQLYLREIMSKIQAPLILIECFFLCKWYLKN